MLYAHQDAERIGDVTVAAMDRALAKRHPGRQYWIRPADDSELGGTSCRYPHCITPTLAERMEYYTVVRRLAPGLFDRVVLFAPYQDEAAIAGLPEDFCRYWYDTCRATLAAARPKRVACQ